MRACIYFVCVCFWSISSCVLFGSSVFLSGGGAWGPTSCNPNHFSIISIFVGVLFLFWVFICLVGNCCFFSGFSVVLPRCGVIPSLSVCVSVVERVCDLP